MKNLEKLRLDFPILQQKVHDHPLIYFDSAATAQMPHIAMDEILEYYATYKSNVDRGLYSFAEKTTLHYEQARTAIAEFIGAQSTELVFTSGATDGINMVARIWAAHNVQAGDEIIISQAEHHSNFLPWQHLAQEKNCILTILPIDESGLLDMKTYYAALSEKTKLVAIFHTSNILGTTNDIGSIVAAAHQVGAKVLVDAAQSVAHKKIDVVDLGCDFLVFSGHKLYGPTGIGCLFIKKAIHEQCYPHKFGGSMVYSAGYDESFWKNAPYCFEAGTPPIAQAIGLGAVVKYLNENVDFAITAQHENALVARAAAGLQELGFHLLHPIDSGHHHLITFYDTTVHGHDIAMYLDSYGIAVRAGNHCVQPYHEKLELESTVRVSFAFYNTMAEVERFLEVMALL
ncbi:MAG: aminotransferase class V-fold PLP-dependent enzyme [Candidatus Dependentiae bacterium]|nr:aminotransferase class V-fold PLP-dependent enzyme [Candidatus Dependentiae bacterium]